MSKKLLLFGMMIGAFGLAAVAVAFYSVAGMASWDRCMDSGGLWDADRKMCNCEISRDDGYCEIVAYHEKFIDLNEVAPELFIQRRGTRQHVRRGEINVDNVVFQRDRFAESIIAADIGLALSLPNYPENVTGPWISGSCTFNSMSNIPDGVETQRRVYGFQSVCVNPTINTQFWLTDRRALVSFQITTQSPNTAPRVVEYRNPIFFNNL